MSTTNTIAYIFDLDGTLIDSEPLRAMAMHKVLQDIGMSIDHATVSQWVLGRSLRSACEDVSKHWPDLPFTATEMQDKVRAVYIAERNKADIRIHSSIEMLRRLSKEAPCAIVSGSNRVDVEEAIGFMGVGDCLRFFLGSEDYPVGKPDPSGFLLAAKMLNVEPRHCIVFEDSAAGILAGKRAGMTVVALVRPESTRQDTSDADIVLVDLADFKRN